MTKEQTGDDTRSTLDEEAKPRTSEQTDAQIEAQKKFRRTGQFPPDPVDGDRGVEDAVERESWNRLKARPKETDNTPPMD